MLVYRDIFPRGSLYWDTGRNLWLFDKGRIDQLTEKRTKELQVIYCFNLTASVIMLVAQRNKLLCTVICPQPIYVLWVITTGKDAGLIAEAPSSENTQLQKIGLPLWTVFIAYLKLFNHFIALSSIVTVIIIWLWLKIFLKIF